MDIYVKKHGKKLNQYWEYTYANYAIKNYKKEYISYLTSVKEDKDPPFINNYQFDVDNNNNSYCNYPHTKFFPLNKKRLYEFFKGDAPNINTKYVTPYFNIFLRQKIREKIRNPIIKFQSNCRRRLEIQKWIRNLNEYNFMGCGF